MTPAELSRTVLRSVRGAVEERELSVAVPARIVVQPPPRPGCGDYASNIALQLAGPAGRPAREVAEILRKRLAGSAGIARVDIAGPGFLNFTLGDGALAGLVRDVLARGDAYGEPSASGEPSDSGKASDSAKAGASGGGQGSGASGPVAASVGGGARGLVVAEVLARIGAGGAGRAAGRGDHVACLDDGLVGEGADFVNCLSASGSSGARSESAVAAVAAVASHSTASGSTVALADVHGHAPVAVSSSASPSASASTSVSSSASARAELAGLVARLGSDEARWVLLRPAAQDPVRVPERPVQREENPRFRVQYAYARTRAMVRGARELGFAGEPGEVMTAGDGPVESGRPLDPYHPRDPQGPAGGRSSRTLQALQTCLATYPSATESALRLGAPDRLVRHLEATADAWLRCREELPPLPVGEEKPSAVHRARLALAEAAGTVLGNGLRLLGISAPEYV
ncbi:ArgS-related anticodon-binding protein NrtL [Streptomyces sp. GS7]|uniref:ArgS-related anticodon-binding protein NrtL n=1 Tax=Streptomyces sp. GS7 TaxID=2692234 RepID=UPI001F205961|nr:DALR anticodon-binding domain-containing protein [Streptomyces sp. GS7]